MGFLSQLFGGGADSNAMEIATTMICDSCGREVPEDDVVSGMCSECYADDDSGPRYCCGAIYEDGETTCKSCGEPL